MGYYSSLEGSFEITPVPRISDFDLEKLKENPKVSWGWECVKVEFVKQSSTETEEDGTEVTRTKAVAAFINSCGQSGHKHYDILPTLQAIVDMLGRDRNYKGYFESRGEDGDLCRIGIVNGVAKEFQPVITWPEEVA